LAGTSKRSCSEEYRRGPPPPFIVAAGETRGRATPCGVGEWRERRPECWWRGQREAEEPLLVDHE